MMGLKAFLEATNTVQIALSFIEFVNTGLDRIASRPGGAAEFDSVPALSEAFFEGWSGFGKRVRFPARVSRYAPTYFPVAYSPQGNVAFRMPGGGTRASVYRNPAPVATNLRTIDGGVLAFLFRFDAESAPHITSPFHLDRMTVVGPDGHMTAPLPYSPADASIPVLLDPEQLKLLEERVRVEGVLRPLPDVIESEIAASSTEFVQLYYHGFFRAESFPEHGFILDARGSSGGVVRRMGDPAPFYANVSAEIDLGVALSSAEVKSAMVEALKSIDPHPRMDGTGHFYRPAFSQPGGYEVIQLSRSPLLVHVAPSRGVANFSMLIDVNQDPDSVFDWFAPSVDQVMHEIGRRVALGTVEPLFLSDRHLASQIHGS